MEKYVVVETHSDGSISASGEIDTFREAKRTFELMKKRTSPCEVGIYNVDFAHMPTLKAKTENFRELSVLALSVAMDCEEYYRVQDKLPVFDNVGLVCYPSECGCLADYELMFNNDVCIWSGDEGTLREAKAVIDALIAVKKSEII